MKRLIFIFQVFLILIQIFLYAASSYSQPSFIVINVSAITVIFSFILSWTYRSKTTLKGYGFSIIAFFILMLWIVSFQVPLEIVYGNNTLLNPNLLLIYDIYIVNKVVSFSSLMLNFFLIAVTYGYKNSLEIKKYNYNENNNNELIIPSMPILFIVISFFIIFIVTINSEYINNGHGVVPLNTLSNSAIGFYIKFSCIYIAIRAYNLKGSNIGVVRYITSFNKLFLLSIFISLVVFTLAHNRLYPIMIVSPLLFSLFLVTKKKVQLVKFIAVFILLSTVATFFKIYGAEIFSTNEFIIEDYQVISNFFVPITAELASSFYSTSILYSMWYSTDFFLYGSTFAVGLLRTIPGLVGFLELNEILYDTGVIATVYTHTRYGVGTNPITDLLVNFGALGSFIIFGWVGYFFGKYETKAYNDNSTLVSYVIYLSIAILVLFYARSSLNNLAQLVLFNYIFIRFYISFYRNQ